jgi:hypothetical protein
MKLHLPGCAPESCPDIPGASANVPGYTIRNRGMHDIIDTLEAFPFKPRDSLHLRSIYPLFGSNQDNSGLPGTPLGVPPPRGDSRHTVGLPSIVLPDG